MKIRKLLPPARLPVELRSLWRRAAARILQLARQGHLQRAHLYVTDDETVWLLEMEDGESPEVARSTAPRERGVSGPVLILTLLLRSPCSWQAIVAVVESFDDARVDVDQVSVQGDVCRTAHPGLPITLDILYPPD